MNYACEPCSFLNSFEFPKTPCALGNNKFYRNFPSPIGNQNCCESPLPLQLDPLFPARSDRSPRKSSKMNTRRSTNCPPRKVLQKKRPTKAPSPACPNPPRNTRGSAPPRNPQTTFNCGEIQNTKNYISTENSNCSTVVRGEFDPHPVDCGCVDCEKIGPNQLNASFCEEKPRVSNTCCEEESACSMSKASEKNVANYFFDNPSLNPITTKKVSACAELIDCIDDNTELWILQCPKCFDVNKLINSNLSSGRKNSCEGKEVDACCELFKTPVNMVCLAPEKATEYKSVCDQIRLIQPKGKIIVTEQDIQQQPSEIIGDMTCSEKEQTDDDCSQMSAVDSVAPLATKKIQKKMNDQRFTIETTVTVENVATERANKKARKNSTKEPCIPFVPPQPQPMKRKTKQNNC